MVIQTLFDLALAVVCRQSTAADIFATLSNPCKQKLLEYFTSHDKLTSPTCLHLLSNPYFGCNLTELRFYLSDEVDDRSLFLIADSARFIRRMTIVECPTITDAGIQSITLGQKFLRILELRNLRQLTSEAVKCVRATLLAVVDLSGCSRINSDGIFTLVRNNPSIRCLYLNHCRGLDDQALEDIAQYLGENLNILELDFLHNMTDPGNSLHRLSKKCPKITQLSLCNFFDSTDSSSDDEEPSYRIEGENLDYVDLCGNYFQRLPDLPATVRTIRLSVTGSEDVKDLVDRLIKLSHLVNIHLELICNSQDWHSIDSGNELLRSLIPHFGGIITRLHISIHHLADDTLALVTRALPYLRHLSLDVTHVNMYYLHRFFSGGCNAPGSRLQSLRLSKLRVSYRLLFAIGRCAVSLTDLEATNMSAVDDRFLRLLADNCTALESVNFNGCRWVTDKGLSALARHGRLKEVRIRGTACTDKSIYDLAKHCPSMEWIAHSDFSGRPKISDQALNTLRNSCIQRVIC